MGEDAFDGLTDIALVARVAELCLEQCRGTVEILQCLNEIEGRGIHLEEAYPSMYEYCMDVLNMSETSACRRLAAARLVRRFPSLLPVIARGELHLSSLILLRHHLTEANVEELVPAIVGKSRSEIAMLLATRAPKPDVPESVTPLVEQASFPSVPPASTPVAPIAARITPLSPSRFEVKLTIGGALHEKLERARDLMMHREPSGSLVVVIERAVDALLANLERERFGKTNRPRASSRGTKPGAISRGAKREVVARDGERCTFESKSGRRCRARAFIELDHVEARALGGSGDASNIRMLCKAHNRFHAEQVFGREHVENAVNRRRRRSRARKVEAGASSPAPVPVTVPFAAPAFVERVAVEAVAVEAVAVEAVAVEAVAVEAVAVEAGAVEAGAVEPVAVEPVAVEPATEPEAAGGEGSVAGFSGHDQILQGLRDLGFKSREAASALEIVLHRRARSKVPCPLPDVLRDAIGVLTPGPAVYRAGGHATFDAALR